MLRAMGRRAFATSRRAPECPLPAPLRDLDCCAEWRASRAIETREIERNRKRRVGRRDVRRQRLEMGHGLRKMRVRGGDHFARRRRQSRHRAATCVSEAPWRSSISGRRQVARTAGKASRRRATAKATRRGRSHWLGVTRVARQHLHLGDEPAAFERRSVVVAAETLTPDS